MNLRRPAVSALSALAFFLQSPGLVQADPPQEAVRALPELPGIAPPPQGHPPPSPRLGDAHADGVTLIAIGALAIAGGVALTYYGYRQGVSTPPCSYCNADLAAEFGGALLSAGGLAAVIVGIVVYATSGGEPVKSTAAWTLPQAPLGADSMSLRLPVGRESAKDTASGAPTFGATLFSHSF